MALTDTPHHVRRRLSVAVEMADEAKAVAAAGIRARHPEWSDAGVAHDWMRLMRGDEIADRVARCSSSS